MIESAQIPEGTDTVLLVERRVERHHPGPPDRPAEPWTDRWERAAATSVDAGASPFTPEMEQRMPRLIERLMTIALIGTTLSACTLGLGPTIPDRVRPTLVGWRAIGLTCTGPTKDNVPSGLLQWSCRSALDGVELDGVFEGDDLGVFDLQVEVPAATPPDAARDAFARLVDATPPLDGLESEIVAFIDRWPGINTAGSFGSARVRVDVDDVWRSLSISPGPRRNVDDAVQ